ncbi:hypothetical protein D039_4961B, partial [Vibrio parahaemolyticus EKP-028]
NQKAEAVIHHDIPRLNHHQRRGDEC